MLKYGALELSHEMQPSNAAKGFYDVHCTAVYPSFAALYYQIFFASEIVKLSASFIFGFVKSVMYAGSKHLCLDSKNFIPDSQP